jgi:hypothetical protein
VRAYHRRRLVNVMSDVPQPRTARELSTAIDALARIRGILVRRIQRAVGNAVLAQMLPAGVVKGGTGLKMRFGETASRYTPDFDAALAGDVDEFEDALAEALERGWAGFRGSLARGAKRAPEDVPEHYVMQPFRSS